MRQTQPQVLWSDNHLAAKQIDTGTTVWLSAQPEFGTINAFVAHGPRSSTCSP